MPTSSRVFLKPFIGGLNTEGSDTDDMVLNTSDELNCTILPEQLRGRRYGFNIEPEGKWIDAGEIITSHCVYHWNNAYGNTNLVVVQINKKLYIFPDAVPLSQQEPLKVVDLTPFVMTSTDSPLDITSVSNSLFVVGKWILPIVIRYNVDTGLLEDPIENNPKFRDFNGVDDGLKVDEMPTTLSKLHQYNLINQGWDKIIYDPTNDTNKSLLPGTSTENGLFYEKTNKYPANNMQWFLGKEKSGEYNTTDLLNTYFGNTPAPKGHFIIDYRHRSRSYACGFTLSDEPYQSLKFSVNVWENTPNGCYKGDKWAVSHLAWHIRHGQQGDAGYCIPGAEIRNYFYKYDIPAEASENIVTGVIVRMFTDVEAWATSAAGGMVYRDFKRADTPNFLYYEPFRLTLIGVAADGAETELGYRDCQMDLTRTAMTEEAFTIVASNTVAYPKYRIKITWPKANTNKFYWYPLSTRFKTAVSNTGLDLENIIDGLPSSDLLKGAITDVESFGGRIFYLCGNTVLFSQTLSTDNQNYDKCYQDADPTSEEVSDVIATDGGMIQLLTMGRGKTMKSFYRGILVFGDKEVTGILSNSINLFSAESYDVVKITTAGLAGRYSVVETDNNIFYWSQHGIYMVGIDENNNISSQCVSLNSIQNWYMNLDQLSKDNVIGYYDYANNRIYWFYPTTLNTERLDGCLIYDLTFNSFMPQAIDGGNVVRDIYGEYVGKINTYLNKIYYSDGKSEDVAINNNVIYDKGYERVIGYIQDKYITDCCESATVNYITPTYRLRAAGLPVVANGDRVLAGNKQDAYYDRKSAGILLISDGTNFSFGDFNDREFRDWDVSPYQSYLVSRPITLGDTFFNKQTPVMQTLFKRTEEFKLKPFEYGIHAVGKVVHGSTRVYRDKYGQFSTGDIALPVHSYIKEATIVIDPHWTGEHAGSPEDPETRYEIGITDEDVVDWYNKVWITNGGQQSFSKADNDQQYTEFYRGPLNSFSISVADWLIELRDLPDPMLFPAYYESESKPEYVDITYTVVVSDSAADAVIIGAGYTTPSGAFIRMRWGWSIDPLSNRWDMIQNGYRPQKDFMHDDYVESRMHVRGRGKAFQVEVRNDSNKDFRLTGLNIITRSPQ